MNTKATVIQDELNLTDEDIELAGLTESEREALNDGADENTDDDGITDEIVDIETIEANTPIKEKEVETDDKLTDEEIAAAEQDKVSATGDVTTVGDEKTDAETTDATDDAVETVDSSSSTFTPQYQADAPVEFQENMDRITKSMEDLGAELDQGDITAAEFQTKNIAFMAERDALTAAATKAEMYQEMNHQNATQLWKSEQDAFFASAVGKVYEENTVLFAAFNESVKSVAREDAFMNRSGADILAEADNRVRSLMAPQTSNENKTDTSNNAKDEMATRKATQKDTVTTLGDLPAADKSDTGGGEFAALDNMDGLELEQAVNRMSPDQQERYYSS